MTCSRNSDPRTPIATRAALLTISVLTLLTCGCAAGPATPSAGGTPVSASATQDPGAPRHFTILQVNDVYRIEGLEGGRIGGLARIRTLREELESQGPVLMLHGGDALFPSVMSKFLHGEPMVEALNLLDGQADAFDDRLLLTFGNHEFDPEKADILKARLAQSDFRWVTSNVHFRPEPDGRPIPFNRAFENVHHAVVLDIGDLTVAVFGLTLDAAKPPYLYFDYELEVRNAAVRATLAALQEHRPDVIIALTHQDLSEDQRLARDFPEIDLIVGGHDHLRQEARVGDTLITKADADAKTAYVIQVDANDPEGVATKATFVNLDETVAKDRDVQVMVERWVARLAEIVPGYNDVVGSTENLLVGEEPVVRTRESAMGNWLADVVREKLQTDIGFIQGGGIRINDNIPADSDIMVSHLEGIFYFGGDVVSFAVTGRDVLEILRNSVSKVHAGDGRFQQVSGLRFEFEASRDENMEPSYRIDPEMVEVLGADGYEPLELDRTYTVATLKHLWDAGVNYGYKLFAPQNRPPLIEPPPVPSAWRAITEQWLAANQRVTVGIEGRIRRVDKQMH